MYAKDEQYVSQIGSAEGEQTENSRGNYKYQSDKNDEFKTKTRSMEVITYTDCNLVRFPIHGDKVPDKL